MFLFVGPNGAPGAGSTIHMSECACEYMIKCVQKIQRENLRWMMAKCAHPPDEVSRSLTPIIRESATKAFMREVDRYFAKTTFAFTVRTYLKLARSNMSNFLLV